MPRVARIFTLNLGSQAISVADFRPQSGGGLVLRDYKRRDLAIENPGEPIRHAQITATIREVLNELGIKSGKVNYAVAGQSVFARFVKLPSVEEEKIDRIIAFEAQQNVPFPIDEVVWDFNSSVAGRMSNCRSSWSRSNPICLKESMPRWKQRGFDRL